jgi:hypothetical protein
MDKLYENAETGCCPRFNPEPWDKKEHVWQDKLFLKDHVVSFMHIPLNFGQVMVRDMQKIKSADALSPEPLMLSDENHCGEQTSISRSLKMLLGQKWPGYPVLFLQRYSKVHSRKCATGYLK